MRILLLIFVLFLVQQTHVYAAPKILLVESYHSAYPWSLSYRQGILENLVKPSKFLHFEMNTKRLTADQYQTQANKAWLLFSSLKPDVVMLADDNALKFLGPKLKQSNTPVIYFGINNTPRSYGVFGAKNITGVLERPLFDGNLFMVRSLLSLNDNAKLLVLFDSSTTAKVIEEEYFGNQKTKQVNKVRAEWLSIAYWDEWKKAVKSADTFGYEAIVIGLFNTIRDREKNTHVRSTEVLKWTSQNTTLPPFAFWRFAVDMEGAIGGLVLNGYEQGKLATAMANQIIAGKAVNEIPPVVGKEGTYLFSKTQLEKWKIDNNHPLIKRAELID